MERKRTSDCFRKLIKQVLNILFIIIYVLITSLVGISNLPSRSGEKGTGEGRFPCSVFHKPLVGVFLFVVLQDILEYLIQLTPCDGIPQPIVLGKVVKLNY